MKWNKKKVPFKGVRNKRPGETNRQARDRRFSESERKAIQKALKGLGE